MKAFVGSIVTGAEDGPFQLQDTRRQMLNTALECAAAFASSRDARETPSTNYLRPRAERLDIADNRVGGEMGDVAVNDCLADERLTAIIV